MEIAGTVAQGGGMVIFIRQMELNIFQPAVPTTAEGLVYALLGMLVLLSLYHFGVRRPFARIGREQPEVVAR